MARVYLTRWEVEEDLLPPACMRCGAEATRHKWKTFQWHPSWVIILLLFGLLPFIIVAFVLTKRMTVRVPLCDQQQGHWLWRGWLTWGGLLLLIGASVATAAYTMNQQGPGRGDLFTGLLCPAIAVAGLVWLVAAIVLQLTAIRPTEITADSITLAAVSPAFVEALHEQRNAPGAAEFGSPEFDPG